jgi:hypothetical protein
MPAWNWFLVPFALKQLLTARQLGVSSITNLEPGAIFTIYGYPATTYLPGAIH